MRTAITAIALAGLTAVSQAQTVGTVSVTSSATTVSVGDTFTIGVYLSDNIPEGSVFYFDVLVTGHGAAFSTIPDSLVGDPTGSNHVFGFTGQVNPNGAHALGGAADILGPTLDAPLDDLTVFTFQVLATQDGAITFDAQDGPSPNTALCTAVPGIVLTPYPYDDIIFESTTVTVIPAPPSAFAIALAFPLATRRRR